MSMSDCIKCWDSPCSCGHDYSTWPKLLRIKLASVVIGCSKEILVDRMGDVISERHPMREDK